MEDFKAVDIGDRVRGVEERIRRSCARSARDPGAVTLVVVSKNFTVEHIDAAYRAGVRDFGENRVQELLRKQGEWERRWPDRLITWHMVGHLQRNKAKLIVDRRPLFHGLDSLRLAEVLDARAREAAVILPCFLQVNTSGEQSKFGFAPADVLVACESLRFMRNLDITGLMTIAAPREDPEMVRPEFVALRELRDRAASIMEKPLRHLSMGMTSDFEIAIEEGATHIRVGTAVFGTRVP